MKIHTFGIKIRNCYLIVYFLKDSKKKLEIKVLKKLKLITNYFNYLFLTKQITLKKLISSYQQFSISSNRKTKLVLLFFQENKKGNSQWYRLRIISTSILKGCKFSVKFSFTLTQHGDEDRRRTINNS